MNAHAAGQYLNLAARREPHKECHRLYRSAALQVVRAFLLLVLVAAAFVRAEAQYCPPGAATACDSVLVVFDDYPQLGADVRATLLGTGAFATVDTFDATDFYGGTPTAAQLAAYHAVLAYSTGSGFSDATLLGDRLAAYHDQGGGVVVATYANVWDVTANTIQGLRGAYGTAANGYALFNYALGVEAHPSDSLGEVLEPKSPLLAGVASLTATQAARSTGPVISGRGAVVARWLGGGKEPLVVRGARGNRTLVELNFYPPSSKALPGLWVGDGAALLRNALKYSRCMPCPSRTFAAAGNAPRLACRHTGDWLHSKTVPGKRA
jgi:hypothetical protein